MAARAASGRSSWSCTTASKSSQIPIPDAVLTADRRPDGTFRQDNVMRYVIATKP